MDDLSAEDASLRASNLKLLETGNFADAELICGGKTFKIHKAVVCTRSVWFEKALTGGFAVRTITHLQIAAGVADVAALFSGVIHWKDHDQRRRTRGHRGDSQVHLWRWYVHRRSPNLRGTNIILSGSGGHLDRGYPRDQ